MVLTDKILAELWTHRISLYYVEQGEGAWLVPENIQQTVIETTPGLPFEVNFQDLNVDGKLFFGQVSVKFSVL